MANNSKYTQKLIILQFIGDKIFELTTCYLTPSLTYYLLFSIPVGEVISNKTVIASHTDHNARSLMTHTGAWTAMYFLWSLLHALRL